MRVVLSVILVAALAAATAFFTRPGAEEFDATLRSILAERAASADLATVDGDLRAALLVACKLSPSECFNTVRALIDVTFEDKLLYTRAVITRPEAATCTGAFGTFWCDRAPF